LASWADGIRLLLSLGANPNKASKSGSTPLLIAANDGSIEVYACTVIVWEDISREVLISLQTSILQIVRILLDYPGIKINHNNVYGYSALYWAHRHQHHEVVALLLQKGATFHSRKEKVTITPETVAEEVSISYAE